MSDDLRKLERALKENPDDKFLRYQYRWALIRAEKQAEADIERGDVVEISINLTYGRWLYRVDEYGRIVNPRWIRDLPKLDQLPKVFKAIVREVLYGGAFVVQPFNRAGTKPRNFAFTLYTSAPEGSDSIELIEPGAPI